MKCSKCGNPLEPGAVFCPSCGEKVEAQAAGDVNTAKAADTSYSSDPAGQASQDGASNGSGEKKKIDINLL